MSDNSVGAQEQDAGADEAAYNRACRELALRYIHLEDSTAPWREAIRLAEQRYPGTSRGWIARQLVALDDRMQLDVSYDPVQGLRINVQL